MLNRSFAFLVMLCGYISNVYSQSIEEVKALGLPVVCITTENEEEPTCDIVYAPDNCMGQTSTNTNKVHGRIQILKGETLLYDSGPYKKDSTGMVIKVRGNSRATLPKKPYKIKLQKKTDLLFRGDDRFKDKEWILNNCVSDLRNIVGMAVNKLIGMQWTPSYQFVNVMMNGKYYGLYLLMESVKRNVDCRLNVDADTGLIFEFDPYYWNEDYYIPTTLTSYKSLGWTFKYPDADDLDNEQRDNLSNYIEQFEADIKAGEYSNWIDVKTFAKWLLGQDILGNGDGAGSNMFLLRYDSESLLQMCTLWDYDVIYSNPANWSSIHNAPFFVYRYLFESSDKTFVQTYCDTWQQIKKLKLFPYVENYIVRYGHSSEAEAIDESRKLDFAVWEISNNTISEDVDETVNWFRTREKTLDSLINVQYGDFVSGIETLEIKEDKSVYNLLGQRINVSESLNNKHNSFYIKNRKKYFIK